MNETGWMQDRSVEARELDATSAKVIACSHRVQNVLGCGFLEKVYENALCLELRRGGLEVQQQLPLRVMYGGVVVGDYVPDLLVEGSLIIEIKAVTGISPPHRQQCLNYLRAGNFSLGLLLNFGRAHLEVGRVVYRF